MEIEIDSRLNDIDDCLYRVAARVLVVDGDRVLLIRETDQETHWSFPGGGIDHGETIESAITREIHEELGVPAAQVASDFQIAYYNIGKILNGVPRMNLFFKVSVPQGSLRDDAEAAERRWFTRDDFLAADIHSTYDKNELTQAIFG